MKCYRVVYVTAMQNGVWVQKNEKYIEAENFNQIILELAKITTSKFYLLEVWEEIVDHEYGAYRLVFPSETGEIKSLDRTIKSYIWEIEKTIGNAKTVCLGETDTKKLRTILQEMTNRFCEK